MAVANADLVDFYFITKYLSLLAEADPTGGLVGKQNLKNVLDLYTQKLNQPNARQLVTNYRNDDELMAILKAFEP